MTCGWMREIRRSNIGILKFKKYETNASNMEAEEQE